MKEKKEPTDDTIKDVYSLLDKLNMFRASLCPSSGDRLNRTACGVSLDVLAAVHIQANTRRGSIQSVS